MLFIRGKDLSLLLLLLMIYHISLVVTQGILRLENKTTMELSIFEGNGLNITVTDTVKWMKCHLRNKTCYIECSFFLDFTTLKQFNIAVIKDDINTVDFIITGNGESSKCTVVACLTEEIISFFKRKENQMNIPNDLSNIPSIQRMCGINDETVGNYIRLEREAIHRIINITNQSEIYSGEDLAMSVLNFNLSTTDDHVPITAPVVFSDSDLETKTAQIWIPLEAFKDVQEDQPKVGVITYDTDQHFKLNLRNGSVLSKIIRIEVPGHNIVNLFNPLKIHFSVNYTNDSTNYTLSCEFFDNKGGEFSWSNTGCNTNQINSSVVECLCNHATPFAVLLIDMKNIDKTQWTILTYISYIGCSLSAFFCVCSVLSYIVNSKARKDVSISIHVSLSAALFLLNITFLLSEWTATLSMNGVCVFVAVTIHYSLLCCFTWMAIEAIHLYLLLVRVFNIYIKHYMLKLSVIGWGVPALIVGGLLTVFQSKPFYGISRVTLTEMDAASEFCWLTDPLIIYGVNIVYFTLVFVFNLGVLITVLKQIFKLRKVDHGHQKIPACKDVGTVLGLMCLLGTTWGLAFFSSGYTNYPILYLFCIFNSMQGFFIFVWMCLTMRKNRQRPPYSKNKSITDSSRQE